MSVATAPTDPRRIAWTRRRRALASAWSDLRKDKAGMAGLVVLTLFILMAVFAPLLADKDGLRAINSLQNDPWMTPSEFPPMGTDNLGRSVWTQFVWGSRISLLVGLAATVLAIVIGTVVGVAAGFYGRRVEGVLMRLTEWFLVIPFLPLAIALAAVLGPSLRNIILVIGITSWPSTARLVRAQVLTVKERLYVDRSRALGASDGHLMARHILPNIAGLVLANTTLTVPVAILSETTLSFLGLGDPTTPSWGTTLYWVQVNGVFLSDAWLWWAVPPGAAITLTVLALALIGTSVEDRLNPALKEIP